MNLPNGYREYLLRHLSAPIVDRLCDGLQTEPAVSIRVNPSRLSADAVPEGVDGRVPWCPEGFYLRQRPLFTADPLLHAGAYYVQEASSMFLSHAWRAVSPLISTPRRVLDLCAAPGGKSTLLRALLPDDCLLVANEPIRARTQVLAENLAKWGHPNVLVTQVYASDLARAAKVSVPFDMIVADVPCSGEGMFRKEEEAVRQWSPAFVAECAAQQRDIIADVWPALRPGGLLFYSTCTFNPEEDEENVEWIRDELGADVLPVPVEEAWHIDGDLRHGGHLPVVHFLPGTVRGEGFFMAVLRKQGEPEEAALKPKKSKKEKKDVWQELSTLPTDLLDIPDTPRVELTLDEAIRYLQREALTLPLDVPRGIVTLCYRGQRLGPAKNIGSRANNLYPQAWRIRSSHLEGHCIFA